MIHWGGDAVNHPLHYNSDPSGIECIEVIRHRNFNVGNAIKYLWRAGLKKGSDDSIDKQVEDLNKAIFYIKDEIVRLTEAGEQVAYPHHRVQRLARFRIGRVRREGVRRGEPNKPQ